MPLKWRMCCSVYCKTSEAQPAAGLFFMFRHYIYFWRSHNNNNNNSINIIPCPYLFFILCSKRATLQDEWSSCSFLFVLASCFMSFLEKKKTVPVLIPIPYLNGTYWTDRMLEWWLGSDIGDMSESFVMSQWGNFLNSLYFSTLFLLSLLKVNKSGMDFSWT